MLPGVLVQVGAQFPDILLEFADVGRQPSPDTPDPRFKGGDLRVQVARLGLKAAVQK